MSRQISWQCRILCLECHPMPMDPEDIGRGWTERKVYVVLALEITCAWCGQPLRPGDVALALTRAQVARAPWEHEFGTAIPAEVAACYKVLTKGGPA